jgi:hypothetical protein
MYRVTRSGEYLHKTQTIGLQAVMFTNEDSRNWPTPRSVTGPTYRKKSDGRQGLSLQGRAEGWPTARAVRGPNYPGRNGRRPYPSLDGRAENWPTPNATDGSKAPETFGRGNPSLPGAAKNWPTPDTGETPAGHGRRGGRPGNAHQSGKSLERSAEAWPTPKANDGGNYSGIRDRDHPATSSGLTTSVKRWNTPTGILGDHPGMTDPNQLSGQAIWATPTAHDERDGTGGDLPTKSLLSRQAPRSGLLDPASARSGPESSPPGPTSHPRSPGRARLNPKFVEWLMGFPPGYTTPVVSTASESSVMRSFLSKERQLLESLLCEWGFD